MTSGRGTILTTAKRSGLEIKFYYRMQCRLPGAFLPFKQSYITWWPHHSGSVAFLSGKSGPVVIALWSGKPVTLCVSWETYTGFLADFLCEQKQKYTQRTRKLNPWPTEGKTENRWRYTSGKKCLAREARPKGLSLGLSLHQMHDFKQIVFRHP